MVETEKNKKIKISRKFIILALLTLLHLTLMVILLYNTSEPLDPFFDECRIGSLAKNIITGDYSTINFRSQLNTYPYSIFGINIVLSTYRHILLGFLAVPFFILFGISAFSLKIVALFISSSAFIIIYLILEEVFDLNVAILTALLFIFAPYSYVTNSSTAFTYNFDVLLLGILIIFLLFRLVFKKNNYLRNVIFLGFLCGLAFLNNMISLILIVNCMIFLFVFYRKFFISKYFFIFIVFFLMGVSPEIIYNYKFAIGNIIPNSGVGGISLSNIKEVVLYGIPASFNFGNIGPIKGEIFNHIYYFIFIFSYFFLLWDTRELIKSNLSAKVKTQKSKVCFFLLYPPLFIFFSFLNLLSVDYPITAQSHRHILPLYLFIFIIIALFIVKLWHHNKKVISITLMLIIIFLGINVKTNMISSDNIKPIYPATCDSYVASDFPLFPMRYTNNISFISQGCDQFKENLKLDCYTGLGQRVYQKYNGDLNLSFIECDNFKNKLSKACIHGLAIATGYDYPKDLNQSIKKCDKFKDGYRKRCYFIIGRSLESYYQRNKSLALNLKECEKIKTDGKYDCINGVLGTA